MLHFLGTLLGSLLIILAGLGIAFYGYGIFRLLLPVVGFFAGLMVGQAIAPNSAIWGWVMGILFALLFAVAAYAYWSVMIGMSGALLGFALGVALMEMLGLWNWLAVVVGLALAVVFGYLYFVYRDLFVMFATGLTGAALVLYGIGHFIPWFSFLQNQGNWFTFLLTLVLGILAGGVQMTLFSGMQYYSIEGAKTPPPILITRTNPT